MSQTKTSKVSNRAEPILTNYSFDQHYGVYRLGDELSVPSKFFWALKNCYVSKSNWIQQRNGYTKITSAALTGTPKLRVLYEVENDTGSRTILTRGGTRWARLNGTTWTDLDTGRANDAYGQVTQFGNNVYMADGGTLRASTMLWALSTVSGTGCPTKISAVHTHNHRLVVNDDDNPLTFCLSRVDQPTNFDTSTADAIIINLANLISGGDKIIGFSTYLQDYLVIWMRRHIAIYNVPTTTASISVQQVMYDVGCISYDGVCQVGKDLWFPSDTGYKALSAVIGNTAVVDINDVTRNIGPYWRESLVNLSNVQDIHACYYQPLDHMYFNLPFSAGHEIWAVSKDLEAITEGAGNIGGGPWTGITSHSMCYTKGRALYIGGSDGHLYQMDSGTSDNGSAVSFSAVKTGLYFENPKVYKSPREFESLMQATAALNATLTFSFETATTSSGQLSTPITINTATSEWDSALWDVSYWDQIGSLLYKSRNLRGRGKVMRLEVSHNTLDAQLRFRNMIIGLTLQGDK